MTGQLNGRLNHQLVRGQVSGLAKPPASFSVLSRAPAAVVLRMPSRVPSFGALMSRLRPAQRMLPWLFKSGAAPVGAWLLLKPLLAKAVASSQPEAAREEHKNPGPTYHDLFEDPNVWTPYEVAKAVVNSLLIMPFRIVLLLGVCVLAWASSKAVLLWHRAE
ncbi:MAG: hypothetical protein Q8P67_09085, partial [archaeon]|nr:hypothetical protein [archaeon]